jgi:hypothetical protein
MVGSGTPEVMTVRLERRELPLWQVQLERLLANLDAGEEAWGTTRPFGGYHESIAEELRVQRIEPMRLRGEVAAADSSPDDQIRVAAPTHLIYHVAHETMAEAAQRVLDAREQCRCTHELTRLREPIKLLAACLETFDACTWVDGHGWNYYIQGLDDLESRREAGVQAVRRLDAHRRPPTANQAPTAEGRSARGTSA